MRVLEAPALPSPARVRPAERGLLRVGVVQHRWSEDVVAELLAGVEAGAARGATLVVLPELTLSRYLDGAAPEPMEGGTTVTFAAAAARACDVWVVASLFEAPGRFNTAVLVAPDGTVAGRTRKLHIPASEGYGERDVFAPGPADADAFPVHAVGPSGARLATPTCYDQWFPEVARAYALRGADVVAYPSAIGSEVRHPGWDTAPMWCQVMVGAAIANGVFVVAANRVGAEDAVAFYGSSFVCDPYGRVLVQAPRDEPVVLVADLDLDARRDWLEAFPFFAARRPEAYGPLVTPPSPPSPPS